MDEEDDALLALLVLATGAATVGGSFRFARGKFVGREDIKKLFPGDSDGANDGGGRTEKSRRDCASGIGTGSGI